jgi:hypothetical protein
MYVKDLNPDLNPDKITISKKKTEKTFEMKYFLTCITYNSKTLYLPMFV